RSPATSRPTAAPETDRLQLAATPSAGPGRTVARSGRARVAGDYPWGRDPGWCNWQHATLWMSNLGFESLSRSRREARESGFDTPGGATLRARRPRPPRWRVGERTAGAPTRA